MFNIIFLLGSILSLFASIIYADTLTLVTLDSPPAEYLENGHPKGLNVEIATEGLKRMGYKARIEFVPWQRALVLVKTGQSDGIIDAAYNKERAKYLHYPQEEIYVEEWYCFKRKDSNITLDKNFTNTKKFTLGISRGFEYGGKIQEAIDKRLFKDIQKVQNNELNIRKLVGKRFDIFVGVKSTILFLAKNMGYSNEIEIVKMTETNQDYLLSSSKTYLAFSKQRITKQFSDQFSEILTQMKKDGTFKKIRVKYQ